MKTNARGKQGINKKHQSFGFAVCALLFAFCLPVQAQQPAKIPWIGYLSGAGSGPAPALVQGLRDLGYVEGKNVAFVFRTAEGQDGRYSDLAAELVRLKVDVIVVDGTSASLAAKKASSTIPIVMTNSNDPVGTGLVASFARPGGNVTGLTNAGGELGGKLLDLLKELVPRLTRVAILSGKGPAADVIVKQTEVPARALGVQLIPLIVQGQDEIEGAFRAMNKEKVNGLLMRLRLSGYSPDYRRIAELTTKNRLPSIAALSAWTDAGGLMSYGSDLNAQHRRAAVYVDKILKGVKPADLPIEQPTKFEFIINVKTAKLLGLTIPQSVLYQADKVIK